MTYPPPAPPPTPAPEKSTSRVFRVFISSTFQDMADERNHLQREVFPEVRRHCKARGFVFQPVDLRWGITDEASLDQRIMRICLSEIDRSRDVSPRLFFMALLGDRYGYVPLPASIERTEFERLAGAVRDSRALALLDLWYRLDRNAVPEEYVLLPRRGRYADFAAWSSEVESPLRRALQSAAVTVNLDGVARRKYFCSATEQEILHGALDSPRAIVHPLFFLRTASSESKEVAPRVFESDGEARERQKALRGRLKDAFRGQVVEYSARWKREGFAAADIAAFGAIVRQKLLAAIDAEINAFEETDPLEIETSFHAEFGRRRSSVLVGRDDELGSISTFLASAETRLLVVRGAGGSGKSALMAGAIARAERAFGRDRVLSRFIGASADASNTLDILRSLFLETARLLGRDEERAPEGVMPLATRLFALLAEAGASRPVVVFLDALDQIPETSDTARLDWLPWKLPEQVKLVASVHSEANAYRMLEERGKSVHFLDLPPLRAEHADRILDAWLSAPEVSRGLAREQRDELLAAFRRCPLPLYLRVAFDDARRWRSFDPTPTLPGSVQGIVRRMLLNLEDHENHGEILVSRSLGYLVAARSGLTEEEVLDVLSQDQEYMAAFEAAVHHALPLRRVPDVVWSRLYFDLRPYLSDRSVDDVRTIGFFHRVFAEIVAEKYRAGETARARHESLARYFDAQPLFLAEADGEAVPSSPGRPNLRRISEAAYQQTQAGLWKELEATLTDLRFVEAACTAKRVYAVIRDFDLATLHHPDTKDERREEMERRERCAKYGQDLIAYADQHSRERGAVNREPRTVNFLRRAAQVLFRRRAPVNREPRTANRVPLPTIESCPRLSDDEIARRAERAGTNPNAGDRLFAFSTFLRTQAAALTEFGARPGFVAQQAHNSAHEGPVAEAAERRLADLGLLNRSFLSPSPPLPISPSREAPPVCLLATVSRPPFVPWPMLLSSLDRLGNWVRAVSVSVDGRRAVTGGDDGTVRVWDVDTGQQIGQPMEGHKDQVAAVAVTPDGRRAVSGGDDGTVLVWDLDSGKQVCQPLKGHRKKGLFGGGGVNSVSVTPDGRRAVSGGRDGKVLVWDLDSGKQVCPAMKKHGKEGFFSGIRGFKDSLIYHRLKRQGKAGFFGGGGVRSVGVAADGRRVVTGGGDGTVRIWDLDSGQQIGCPLGGGDTKGLFGEVLAVSVTPDGLRAVSGGDDGTVRLWDLDSRQQIGHALEGHRDGVNAVAVTPDGRLAVSGSDDHTLRVWDLGTGEARATLKGPGAVVSSVAVTPDGRRAVSGGGDAKVQVWNLASGQQVGMPLKGYDGPVIALSVTPDGRRAVSGGFDGKVRVWDLDSGQQIGQPIEAHEGGVNAISITPDGQHAVTGGFDEGEVRVWSLGAGQQVGRPLIGHRYQVHAVAVTPDGRRAVSGGVDWTVRVWDLDAGEQIGRPLRRHLGPVWCVSVTPDGRFAVCAGGGRETFGYGIWIRDTRSGSL
ncbi:MAG: DUF4062 domain-containing protein [Planctomycetes bacterium]|nr:DUF4062 domain-containing protein [Planctomycetota bacterium]